jgi:hypothetical protein
VPLSEFQEIQHLFLDEGCAILIHICAIDASRIIDIMHNTLKMPPVSGAGCVGSILRPLPAIRISGNGCFDAGASIFSPFFNSSWEERLMKRFYGLALTATAAMLFACNLARAEIVVQAYYHLGESDSGAVADAAGNGQTVDSTGNGYDMTYWQGTMAYSSSVAASAAEKSGSNLSMNFASDATSFYLYQGDGDFRVTDNFGIEGWFKVDDLSQQGLVFAGDSFGNGYGLYVLGGHVQGLYGAMELFDTGIAPTAGEWFYAALVRDGGVTNMYVNDSSEITFASTNAPFEPGAQISLGIAGYDPMHGNADEVRVFTFAPGSFDASTDLLISQVPEPSTLALLAMGLCGLAAYAWRKRK